MLKLYSLISLLSIVSILVISYFELSKTKFRNIRSLRRYNYENKKEIQILEKLKVLIYKSNIEEYVFHYSIVTHIILSIIIGILFYQSNYLSGKEIMKISYSLIGFLTPTAFLNILGIHMENKIKKQSIAYLTGLRSFNMTYNDIFVSFEHLSNSTEEPLRKHTKLLVKKKKAKIDQFKCLEDFKNNIGKDSELGLFIDNLKISILEGNGTNQLIDEYVKDLGPLIEIDEKHRADEIMSYGICYLFIIILILALRIASSTYDPVYIEALWHQGASSLSLIVSFVIILKTVV